MSHGHVMCSPFSLLVFEHCERDHEVGVFAASARPSSTALVTGHHYFTGRDMKWGWAQFNNYSTEPAPEWTSHSIYKGRVEHRVSYGHTGIIAEFGRYCDEGHIIRVDFESMNIHADEAKKCFDQGRQCCSSTCHSLKDCGFSNFGL